LNSHPPPQEGKHRAVASLQTISVNCNHCGATLQVDENTRFVTCNYCHSRLAIQRSDSAVFTEVLEKIEEHTGELAEDVKLIRLQNEIEQLDREWMMTREKFMLSGQNGQKSDPSIAGGVAMIIVGVVAGVLWISFNSFAISQAGAPPFMPFFMLFGVLVAGMFVFGGIRSISKTGELDTARKDYEIRRADLISRIDAEKLRQQ
jgi:DNA-directed RNA polymerase subunit RPC12/RpoP